VEEGLWRRDYGGGIVEWDCEKGLWRGIVRRDCEEGL
jgi:hypothetical protein